MDPEDCRLSESYSVDYLVKCLSRMTDRFISLRLSESKPVIISYPLAYNPTNRDDDSYCMFVIACKADDAL